MSTEDQNTLEPQNPDWDVSLTKALEDLDEGQLSVTTLGKLYWRHGVLDRIMPLDPSVYAQRIQRRRPVIMDKSAYEEMFLVDGESQGDSVTREELESRRNMEYPYWLIMVSANRALQGIKKNWNPIFSRKSLVAGVGPEIILKLRQGNANYIKLFRERENLGETDPRVCILKYIDLQCRERLYSKGVVVPDLSRDLASCSYMLEAGGNVLKVVPELTDEGLIQLDSPEGVSTGMLSDFLWENDLFHKLPPWKFPWGNEVKK